MTDIQKIEKWTEVSKGYWRYAVASKVCYELMALQQGSMTDLDYYALYVTGEFKDQTGTPYFKRKCLKSCETLANCLYAASEDLKANPCDEEGWQLKVTTEDIQIVKNLIEKPSDENFMIYPSEAKAIVKLVLATYERMNKE